LAVTVIVLRRVIDTPTGRSTVLRRAAGEPTRPRGIDLLSLAISVSSMVAGWLALWIGP